MAKKTKVMVVEDDATLRGTLAELLQIWGYEAETACDGLEALEKISSFDPMVIISDLRMPRMGGMELLQSLRYGLRDISCIIITADLSLEEAIEVTRLGAFSCLQKPVAPEQLHMDLRSCLEHASTQRSWAEGLQQALAGSMSDWTASLSGHLQPSIDRGRG